MSTLPRLGQLETGEALMVWGMNHPPGSNGFYLPGDFEGSAKNASCGWRVRLAQYYHDEMASTEQAIFQDENNAGSHWYACHAVNKFSLRRDLFGTVRKGSVTDIMDHEIPKYFKTNGTCNNLASMALFPGPVLTADEALKSIIEWVEPKVHKFFPIEVRRSKDGPPVHHRYILVVEQRNDSFSEIRSDRKSFHINQDRQWVEHIEKPNLMRRLAFSKEQFGSAHMWHEKRIRSFLLCFSDRLQAEIVDAGLRIPRHFSMVEF